MKLSTHCLRARGHQPGIALLAGLVLLAAISLLALVATASMILQQNMSGNFTDSQHARQGAAVAVSQGHAVLFGIGPDGRAPDCIEHCFLSPLDTVIRQASEMPVSPEYEDATWWDSWATEAGVDPVTGGRVDGVWNFAAEPPRFLIEEVRFDAMVAAPAAAEAPAIDGIGYYRVLGRAVGRGPAAVAVSEAIIARPWLSDTTPDPGTMADSSFCTPFEPWYDCGLMAWRQRR
jgi:Tfp pilus assembly protein PilX